VRDIRNDLVERLAAVDARQRDTEAEFAERLDSLHRERGETIAAIVRERGALREMLELESRREGAPAERAGAPFLARLLPFSDFIVTKVHTLGPMDKEQLRAEAEAAGYSEGGRTLHTTLLNAVRHGKLWQLPDGRYEFAVRSPEGPLFGLGQSEEADVTVQ